MEPHRFHRLREAFDEAAELSHEARGAFLLALRREDAELAGEVEAMLAARTSNESFLESPASELSIAEDVRRQSPGADALLGTMLGHFAIEGVLGRGGMGVVYRARQERPRREVALKLIRPGAMNPALLRRFEHESQILGRLKHPGIAQVYEAGTLTGPGGEARPYFAMELVEGRPLMEHAAEAGLDRRARLALFALVCDAVEHAHQKGVIHRDLKPANILVEPGAQGGATVLGAGTTGVASTFSDATVASGAGQPKVLDFGVARFTDSDLATTTIQTNPGQVIGTLQYMSPEQVRGATGEIDTRCDIYALGVILFEMLTGRLPHDVRDKPIGQAARIICDEEPRQLGSVDRGLKGDLETIAAKALNKEPGRRYATAAALATDVRRHLADLPILARRPSAAYQVRKFAARNRVLVAGVAAVFLALCAGVVGTSMALVRARAAEEDAIKKALQAREAAAAAANESANNQRVSLFLLNLFSKVHPGSRERGSTSRQRAAETVDELLQSGSESISFYSRGRPEVEGMLCVNFGDAFRARGDFERAEALLKQGVEVWRGQGSGASEKLVAALNSLGRVYDDRGDNKAAARAYREALEIQNANQQLNDTHGWITIQTVATSHWKAGEFDEARALYDRLFAMVESRPEGRSIISQAKNNLAGLYVSEGRYAEAEPIVKEAIEGMRASSMTDMADEIASSEGNYAWLLLELGRLDEAEALAVQVLESKRRIYKPGHLKLAKGEHGLAQILVARGRAAEALPLLESALPVYRSRSFAGSDTRIEAETTLGECLTALKRLDEARAALDGAIASVGQQEGSASLSPANHSALLRARAALHRAEHQEDEAARLENEAEAIERRWKRAG